MIRALFGFVLTLGLLCAGALWALRSFDPAEWLRAASPPVSRTVELLADELTRHTQPVEDPVGRVSDAGLSPAPQSKEAALVDPADTVVVASEPLPDKAPDDHADTALEVGTIPGRRPDQNESLSDSALLVRRMLGLYQQSLEPR